MTKYRIVNSCNFDSDYPNETFVNVCPLPKEDAQTIADIINKNFSGNYSSRYWRVVPENYVLAPAFEP